MSKVLRLSEGLTESALFEHQGTTIPVRCGNIDGQPAIEASLRKGQTFKPGSYKTISCTVEVIEGSGIFELRGRKMVYKKDSHFYIPKGTLHAFVQVDEYTILRKKVLEL